MVNLKELSQHLGLSKTTVSRALNGFSDVNEETRLRVQEAAERFDYQPNAAAQRLATGRSGALGVVFPPNDNLIADPIYAEFLAGVADGAAREKRDLVVGSSHDSEEANFRRLARAKAVDVMILNGLAGEDLRVRLLSHLGIQAVVHGRTASSLPYAYVDIDNEGGFRRATELLLGLGHRRVALINGDMRYTRSEHRLAGWSAAHAAAGLAADERFAAAGASSEEAGHRAAGRLLALRPAPTAIICANMFAAAGCCRAVRDLGLEIGADVSVLAHDDGLSVIRPESYRPPLTTTYAPLRAAGIRVAEFAGEIVRGTDPADLTEVRPVDIIFRESTRPPRKP